MIRLLFLFIILFASLSGFASAVNDDPQETKDMIEGLISEPAAPSKTAEVADVPPSFPGGAGAMMSWLGRNMKYPDNALSMNVQGRVIVKFVVYTDGTLGDIKVIKSVDPELDKEAVRLVKAMPKWNPGLINGKATNAWYTLPVTFKLN